MTSLLVAFFAYLLDRLIGEFNFIKHPVIFIGDAISWFEKYFYKESVFRGFLLTLLIIFISGIVSVFITWIMSSLVWYIELIVTAFIASIFLAHRMLHDAVFELISAQDPREKLSMLVSRDTQELSDSEVYKAGVETYAENLSDGVIAPLFYLLLFGLPGIVIYKAINTLDSMVGYRNERYENFGKASALLDDVVNFLPSRVTAMMIMFLSRPTELFNFYNDGKKHASPNAGHPITAMALAIGVRLGGPTRYFGNLQEKVYFGKGREEIEKEDLLNALRLRSKVDAFILASLLLTVFIYTF